jgi:outer membrane autotransporter protein
MVRQLQMQTLYDREGSQLHSGDNSMWARFKAGRSESTAAGDNVEMTSNYSQFQFGGDIAAFNDGEQSLAVGVMASYVNAQTDSVGNRGADGSQFSASGSVDGYNVGMYATWFADQKDHRGLYVDSWYQYGIYSNSVEDGDLGTSDYDSTANAISVETGYRYDIALRKGNSVSLTPQAQIVWQDYSADTVKDHSGTTISGQDSQSWTSRLGLRLDSKLYKDNGVVQPFAEVNWLHSSDDMAATFGNAEVKQDIPENRAELKAGIQVNVNDRWSITGAASGQTGSNDYSDLNGNLNIHYRW